MKLLNISSYLIRFKYFNAIINVKFKKKFIIYFRFTKLRTSGNNVKLSSDICDRILGVAAKSVSLQEIHMPSIGARWEFAARLSQVICKVNTMPK